METRPVSTASDRFEQFHSAERGRLVRTLALVVGDVSTAAESIDEAMVRAWRDWDRVRMLEQPLTRGLARLRADLADLRADLEEPS